LEYIVESKRLDVLPENYANSEAWHLKNSKGQTPLEILNYLIEREAQRATWKAESVAYVAVCGVNRLRKSKKKNFVGSVALLMQA
jgi:hypothetical protein